MTTSTTNQTTATPQLPKYDEILPSAIACFHKGEVAQGMEVLRHALHSFPHDHNFLGHLAWAVLNHGDLNEAKSLYEQLAELSPDHPEIHLRLAQIKTRQQGFDPQVWKAVLKIADLYPEKPALSPEAWHDIQVLLVRKDQLALLRQAAKIAKKQHPQYQELDLALKRLTQRRWREVCRPFVEALPWKAFFRFLLRFRFAREALARASPDAESYRNARIEKFYQEGSVGITFPQAPPEMTPQAFPQYMDTTPSPWFEWFKAHTPIPQAQGHRLLDVGSGPGFIGQHFQWLGYKITALTGSPSEQQECRERGMDILEGDMHAIALPTSSFDAVLASHVLEHSVSPLFLLWEFHRILKPQGLVFVNLPLPIDAEPRRDFPEIYDPETDTYRFECDRLGRASIPEITYYSYGFPPHLFVLTPYQWKWLFRQAGFQTLAACIETPQGEHLDLEPALEKLGRRPHHCNQLFLLRRKDDGSTHHPTP